MKHDLLCLWLRSTDLIHLASRSASNQFIDKFIRLILTIFLRLKESGVNTLADVYRLENDLVFDKEEGQWWRARQTLPTSQEDLHEFEARLSAQLPPAESTWTMWGKHVTFSQ